MNVDLNQFLDTFFQECGEALDSMESTLLKLDVGAPDAEMVNTVFRAAHSLKGGAGMFGFTQMMDFTHHLETLLDGLRAQRVRVTRELVEVLLKSVDALRAMIASLQRGEALEAGQTEALVVALKAAEAAEPIPCSAPGSPPAAVAAEARCGGSGESKGGDAATESFWAIDFRPGAGLLARGNDPLRFFNELSGLGTVVARANCESVPELGELDPEQCLIRWQLTLQSDAPRESIELIFEWAQGDCELEIARLEQPALETERPAEPAETAPAAPRGDALTKPARALPEDESARSAVRDARSGASESGSIRVSIDKIDELMNAVGEIVITQSMLTQQVAGVGGGAAARLRDGLSQLERNVRELQETVMRVRMLPISVAFSRFPRLVRDVSQRLGKQIDLQLSGEQTELDKIVLERIGDPLVHLVRNSIDHGIETPDERLAAGKPAQGTLHLNAYHKGGSIRIEVSDDGRGLNRDRILDKARARGLIGASDVLSEEEIFELIFLPGFSTAERTTDLSGRGVGMDVVRRNIVELGGTVDISSQAGQGTRIGITLPLTLAIVDGQLVGVGRDTYIVPLVTIVESLQARPGTVTRLAGRGEVFEFRGDYLPLIRLDRLFSIEARARSLDQGLVMVVEGDGRKVGLFVDELLGQQQVVIKSLDTNYRRIEGISGATILGEGAVALILDVPGLIRLAAETHSQAAA